MIIMAITISPRLTLHLLPLISLQVFLVSVSLSSAQPNPLSYNYLNPFFYAESCPMAEEIVRSVMEKAVMKEARVAASLLRLHFHDCFVEGCDASILLDDSGSIVSEKRSNPNRNSARGFEVVDQIKSALEEECPKTVSCADILAIAARDSVVLSGGLGWEVLLGRRDSKSASFSGANKDIPAPNSTLETLIRMFRQKGLNEIDLVALSGSHTIGLSRCASFKQRLYNQNGNGRRDVTLDSSYYARLISGCPRSGGDSNLFPLDYVSPTQFDNDYFKNLLSGQGLLNSDEELFAKGQGRTTELVRFYAENEEIFHIQFAASMVKLGNTSPLTGPMGEIRVNCRTVLD